MYSLTTSSRNVWLGRANHANPNRPCQGRQEREQSVFRPNIGLRRWLVVMEIEMIILMHINSPNDRREEM